MEVLSLKWNNHQTVFSHQISELRKKTIYTDATLACHGRFYQVHRLVLSTCSEYFSSIFNQTSCPNPVIVLKDMACKDLEFLLDYMYAGEVSVRQIELPSLISAAESLQIKGLAISDDTYSTFDKNETKSYINNEITEKSSLDNSHDSMFESDCNERTIQKISNIGNSVHQTTKCVNNKNTILSHKDINDHVLANADSLPNFKVSDTYTTIIKAEPELVPCGYESTLNDEPPFTSAKESLSNNDEAANSFRRIPNRTEFTEDTSNICTPTQLQDESNNLLPIESPKMLLQDPFLQLPAPGVMGRSPRIAASNHTEVGSTLRRDYTCSFCGRVFSHRTNQLAHERIHTGEKPFQCLYCPFRTALKGNLKNHIFTRHSGDWKSIKHLIFPSKDS